MRYLTFSLFYSSVGREFLPAVQIEHMHHLYIFDLLYGLFKNTLAFLLL